MNKTGNSTFWLWLLLVLLGSSCARDKHSNGLVFSVEDECRLGRHVAWETDSIFRARGQLLEPSSRLPRVQQAYARLDRIMNQLRHTGPITYREELAWEVRIIQDNKTLFAFATPGGYIYVYTGLIEALDSEDELAAVLAHEMAHIDRRHLTGMLQQQYSVAMLLSVALGNNRQTATSIATLLAGLRPGLQYSREAEREANHLTGEYLRATSPIARDGAAGLSEKLKEGQEKEAKPGYLYTHHSPQRQPRELRQQAQGPGAFTSNAPTSQLLN